ncbi:hypothetical protein S8a_00037 [Klebsiella phage VLCpiS8a]|nr:hypothetical protein S8a_00037 [Klebsiella phage VLCpiS8a]
MNKILNFTAVAAEPAERLACGLLDSHCDNGLAVARTVYDEIKALHADMYFYVKGGTLGALCVRMNNDAQQIVELTRELDKERAKNQNQLLQLDRQARELVDLKDENDQLKNSYAIASADRVDLEKRNKEITERLSAWVLWAGRVLGHEEANDELQRDAIDRLHDRAGNNLRGVREHRDELLQQLANVNMELTACKEEIDELKKSKEQLYALLNKWHEMSSCALLECFNVKCSSIASHEEVMSLLKELTYREAVKQKQNDEHICRLSEEAEELKEDRALASGQLENWRTVTRSILDVHFNCYPVSHIGDKELRDLLAHEVEQLASKHKQLSSDHGALRNAAQSCDLLRRGAELDLADAKACNQRQNETIKKYQADADELKRWQQWALVQFGLHGSDQDVRDGIDSFLCSSATDREAWFLECGKLKNDIKRERELNEALTEGRNKFMESLRKLLADSHGIYAGLGYEAMIKACCEVLTMAAQERIDRRKLADKIAKLFNTGVKSGSLNGIERSIDIIRKQMDEFGERAEKAGDELEALKKSMMIPAATGTMDSGDALISSVTVKAEQFNIIGSDGKRIDPRESAVTIKFDPVKTKVTLSPDMRDAVVNAIVDDIREQSSVIMAAIRNK